MGPARVAAALERRAQMLRHRGDAVLCPICGARLREAGSGPVHPLVLARATAGDG